MQEHSELQSEVATQRRGYEDLCEEVLQQRTEIRSLQMTFRMAHQRFDREKDLQFFNFLDRDYERQLAAAKIATRTLRPWEKDHAASSDGSKSRPWNQEELAAP